MTRAKAADLLCAVALRLVRRLADADNEHDRAEAEAACRRFIDGLPDALRRLEAA